MTDFVIPCDTVSRLSHVATSDDEWFRSIRIDNGLALASNRRYLACEQIAPCVGVMHLALTPELVEQCRTEAQFDGVLTVSVMDGMNYATARTSFGWIAPGNVGVYSDNPNTFDRWRSILPTAAAKAPRGALYLNTEETSAICKSSPSGRIVFEQFIDTSQPSIIRDVHDDKWFALFYPINTAENYSPATLPGWVKP